MQNYVHKSSTLILENVYHKVIITENDMNFEEHNNLKNNEVSL